MTFNVYQNSSMVFTFLIFKGNIYSQFVTNCDFMLLYFDKIEISNSSCLINATHTSFKELIITLDWCRYMVSS